MKARKVIGLTGLILFAGIQLIRPAHNNSEPVAGAGFADRFALPDSINRILMYSCYDCHSNHTRYPWYSQIQPVGWILARHVKRGKAELNFSEFDNYSVRKQTSKFKSIIGQVKEKKMPLSSYKLLHRKARLSEKDRTSLVQWFQKIEDSLITINP